MQLILLGEDNKECYSVSSGDTMTMVKLSRTKPQGGGMIWKGCLRKGEGTHEDLGKDGARQDKQQRHSPELCLRHGARWSKSDMCV